MEDKNNLENIIDLEIEKSRLGSIYYIINKNLKNKVIEFSKVIQNEYDSKCKEIKNNKINEERKINNVAINGEFIKPKQPVKQEIKGAPIVLFIIGVMEVFAGLAIDFSFVTILGGFVAVCSLLGLYAQYGSYKQFKEDTIKYERELYEYNIKQKEHDLMVKENEERMKKIQECYDIDIQNAKNILNESNIINEKYSKMISDLKEDILKIDEKLNTVYDSNDIPINYRNLYTISNIYNYLKENNITALNDVYKLFETNPNKYKSIKELNKDISILEKDNNKLFIGLNNINASVSLVDNIIGKLNNENRKEYIEHCFEDITNEFNIKDVQI